jgi:hypothetical protein
MDKIQFITGMSDFGRELCKAIGEEPQEVRSITLHCSFDDIVSVTIEKMISAEDGKKVVEVVRKFVNLSG